MNDDISAAGWYPDPDDATQQRYWDGAAWTAFREPAPAAPTETTVPLDHTMSLPVVTGDVEVAPEPVVSRGPGAARGWPTSRAWWAIGLALGVALVLIWLAVSANSSPPPVSPAVPAATVTVTASPTPVPTPTPTPTPDVGQVGGPADQASGTFLLPDETGKDLQAAQDDLRAISGDPFFTSYSDDATGQGRMQIFDSGWQICSQTPDPGTLVSADSTITFHTVRLSESCPGNGQGEGAHSKQSRHNGD